MKSPAAALPARTETIAAVRNNRLINSDLLISDGAQVEGTVIAQDPRAGEKVDENTKVRINVSSGPKPIGVPDVRGSSFDSAASQLQALGFAVARKDAESDQAEGTVIDQDPAANRNGPAERTISPPDSALPIWVIPTRESLVIARHALAFAQ